VSVNFGKIEGPKCKICKTGPLVDFKETQGLLCKMAGNFGWGFIFQRIKSWTGSTQPWTVRAGSVHRGSMAALTEGGPGRGGALTGARPPAAPVHQSSPAGVQQREERTGSWARASPRLRQHRGGRATVVQNQRRRRSVRGRLKHGEKRREAGRSVVNSGGGAHLL
jgi:hypothetical protein